MTPREEAQVEAEKTFETFMLYSKRTVMWLSLIHI